MYENVVWRSASRELLSLRDAALSRKLAARLITGWGNPEWSAEPEYLCECHAAAARVSGTILECGSGLTTIVMAAAARTVGHTVTSLEHDPKWRAKVIQKLAQLQLLNADIVLAPITDYGDFDWYGFDENTISSDVALVVCDGPPRSTRGGRYGLLPRLGNCLGDGCTILLDDFGRIDEQRVVEGWRQLRPLSLTAGASNRGFARITLGRSARLGG